MGPRRGRAAGVVAKAGWGYWARIVAVPPNLQSGDDWNLVATPKQVINVHGPVSIVLNADDCSGCVELSNNTAELSAIPQVLVAMLG